MWQTKNHPTIGMVYATHLGPFSILVCIILGSCYCWIYLIILIQINSGCISWVVLISKRVVGGLFVQFWGTKCRCALATLQEALRFFIVGNVPYSLRHALHNKSGAQRHKSRYIETALNSESACAFDCLEGQWLNCGQNVDMCCGKFLG